MTDKQPCTVDGCKRHSINRGYCSVHHLNWRREGDPLVTVATRSPDSPAWTYASFHGRLRYERGKASVHPCAWPGGCESQAKDWAYDRKDPDDRRGTTSEGVPVVYSTKREHYFPLCAHHHGVLDHPPRKN